MKIIAQPYIREQGWIVIRVSPYIQNTKEQKTNACAFNSFLCTKKGRGDFYHDLDNVAIFATKEEATTRLKRITVKEKKFGQAYRVVNLSEIPTKVLYTVDIENTYNFVYAWSIPACFGKWESNQCYKIENVKKLLETERTKRVKHLEKEIQRLNSLNFSEIEGVTNEE